MLLAIDAGNTNLVFALVEGRAIKARWRIATDPRRTADEYAVWLSQLLSLEGFDRAAVTGVIIATVVPRALHNLQVLATKYFGVQALIAGVGPVAWGMAIDVDEPASLGAISPALTRAASSRRAATCRLTRWSPLPPSCRASPSRRPPLPALSAPARYRRCTSASIGAISR